MARPTPPNPPNPTLGPAHERWLTSVIVRMLAPAPGEDANPDMVLARRVLYYRALRDGTAPVTRKVKLPQGTCLVCGCLPIERPGGHQCQSCAAAMEYVVKEKRG